jgi:ribonuclease I
MRNDWDAYEKRLTVLNLTMAFTVHGLRGQNVRQAVSQQPRECTWATSP